MANTPHNEDPKRDPKSKPPRPDEYVPEDGSLDQLPPLDPNLLESTELPELDPNLLESTELPAGAFLDDSLPGVPDSRAPESGEVRYDTPPPAGQPGSLESGDSSEEVANLADLSRIESDEFGSGTDWLPPKMTESGEDDSLAIPSSGSLSDMGSDLGMSSEHLKIADHELSSDHLAIPSGEPVSSDLPPPSVAPTASEIVPPGSGKYEPIAPARGWLESVEYIPAPQSGQAAKDAVEGSDIFGPGPVQPAMPIGQSDVLGATAHAEAAPADSGDLPVAEEVVESSGNLFSDSEPPAGLPFDSARIADAPPLPDAAEPVDVPDYGRTPELATDASSILSELDDDEGSPKDSSAVRLEAPGIERTLSSDHGEGTEFDLTINDALPHELIAEAASDHGPAEWESLPDSDMFADGNKTIPEITPQGVMTPAPPSSIFSDRPRADDGSDVRLDAIPSRGEGDSSVEFSDHPESESEAEASSILGRPPQQPKPKSKHSVDDFELPATPAAEWGLTEETEVPSHRSDPGDSSILSRDSITQQDLEGEEQGTLPEPRKGIPAPAAKDRPADPKPAKAAPKGKQPSSHGDHRTSDPSVEIDWMAGSSSQEVNLPDGLEPTPPPPPVRKAKAAPVRAEEPTGRPASKKGAWVGGTLLGMVIAGGGFAGAYFGDLLPKREPTGPLAKGGTGQTGGDNTKGGTGNTGGVATVADAASALRAGDPAKAKQILEGLKDATPAAKALAGEAGLFALVQDKGAAVAADDPALVTVRESLQAVVADADAANTPEGKRAAVKAAIQLGVTHEIAGDATAAKKVYEDAKARFPEHAATFDAALDRLAATRAAEPTSRRLTPDDAHQILLAVTLLQADGKVDETEAGVHFWKAVNRAAGEKYTDAIAEIQKAKAAHIKQARAKAGAGLNPLSDPLEQIFPRCCDDLKAYWELRAAIYANKAVADLYKKDGAEKAFAQLAAAQTKAADAIALTAKLKDATDKLTKANADYKDATDKLAKANTDLTKTGTDLTKANADLKKAETDLKDAKAMVTTLQKDAKAAEEIRLAVEKKAEAEEKARKLAETAAKDADTARAKSEQFIASLAKELQAAKLLPEKYSTDELLAAQRRTAERATGPTLNTLVPTGMMAVGGSGLTAGQLVDIAERLSKAETAAKTAADRLATETKQLKTDHAAELKKLTDGYAADLKKATDAHTAEVKKLTDAHAIALKKATEASTTDITKLKEGHQAELKKASDKFAVDAKALKDGFEGKVKTLEAAVAAERDRVAKLTEQFKRDLGSAISPSEALDLWLPLLVELRRPADADPALASATKVIASAPADSEDMAKARTVAAIALLIKQDRTAAKAHLKAAKASPAHAAALAAKKPWAAATDGAIAALDDPFAPYRRPVNVPTRDLLTAARQLDAGVKAYREGRYEAAVAALGDSVKADATNPVAWYYLGAARWATGATDAAKNDFQQGATREVASDLTARTINAALGPIQGAARDALTAARP